MANQGQTLDATMTITGTKDGTSVSVKVSSAGRIGAGNGIQATSGGNTLTLSLNAGDVAELVAAGGSDFERLARPGERSGSGHQRPPLRPDSTQPAFVRPHRGIRVPRRNAGQTLRGDGAGGAQRQRRRPPGSLLRRLRRHASHVRSARAAPRLPDDARGRQVAECGTPAAPCNGRPDSMSNCGITLQDFEVQGDQIRFLLSAPSPSVRGWWTRPGAKATQRRASRRPSSSTGPARISGSGCRL